ncbi:putative peptidoglycan binding protein [Varunaivibrio sulfuroxidans]|uniref:Putative peptidoglycan binding protein n=2 Tax=Varunaivibrio sulfuroxidans TaxID=1773489 RepID=A0A4R3JD04_9PROT|nr:putative peptidoglycan binding protein [Varunaivibrio sulfuroxidans]
MEDKAFTAAVETVLKHEGGFSADPNDPGGATHYGISLRYLLSIHAVDTDGDGFSDFDFDRDGDIDAHDIRAMTRGAAIEIYRDHFWTPNGYGDLPPFVGPKVFDLAVNMGPRQAHKLLQRAARACEANLTDDGVLGPKTRAAIAGLPPMQVVAATRSEAAGFYRTLIAEKPKLEIYRTGWLRRAYA